MKILSQALPLFFLLITFHTTRAQLLRVEEVHQLDSLVGINLYFGNSYQGPDSLRLSLFDCRKEDDAFVKGTRLVSTRRTYAFLSTDSLFLNFPTPFGDIGTLFQLEYPDGKKSFFTLSRGVFTKITEEFLLFACESAPLNGDRGSSGLKIAAPIWEVRLMTLLTDRGMERYVYSEGSQSENKSSVARYEGILPFNDHPTDSVFADIVLRNKKGWKDEFLFKKRICLKGAREVEQIIDIETNDLLPEGATCRFKIVRPKPVELTRKHIFPDLQSFTIASQRDTLIQSVPFRQIEFQLKGKLPPGEISVKAEENGLIGYFLPQHRTSGPEGETLTLKWMVPSRFLILHDTITFIPFADHLSLGKTISYTGPMPDSQEFLYTRLELKTKEPACRIMVISGNYQAETVFDLPQEKNILVWHNGSPFQMHKDIPATLDPKGKRLYHWQENMHRSELVSIFVFSMDENPKIVGSWTGSLAPGAQKKDEIQIPLTNGQPLTFKLYHESAAQSWRYLPDNWYHPYWKEPRKLDQPSLSRIDYYQAAPVIKAIFNK